MANIADSLTWIESHPVLVDLIKALVLLVFAWFAGLRRLVRKFRRKPRVWVVEPVSRCYLEKLKLDGDAEAVRASFLLSVGVTNPTSEKLVVESFSLQFRARPFWWSRSLELDTVPLPDLPRLKLPTATKVSRVWFINYPGYPEGSTAHGRIEPMEFEDAYLLFVSATFGNWNPRVENDHVKIWIKVRLTTGEELVAATTVKATADLESFEERVPGIKAHIASDQTWNISLKEHRSVLKGKRAVPHREVKSD